MIALLLDISMTLMEILFTNYIMRRYPIFAVKDPFGTYYVKMVRKRPFQRCTCFKWVPIDEIDYHEHTDEHKRLEQVAKALGFQINII